MPPLREGPRIETRLSQEEYDQFLQLSHAKRVSIAQLARDALKFYLENHQVDELDERESLLEKRIKKMENRLAGLMAKANIDLGVVIALMYRRMNAQTRDEEVKLAQQKSVMRLRKGSEVADELRNQYLSDDGE